MTTQRKKDESIYFAKNYVLTIEYIINYKVPKNKINNYTRKFGSIFDSNTLKILDKFVISDLVKFDVEGNIIWLTLEQYLNSDLFKTN